MLEEWVSGLPFSLSGVNGPKCYQRTVDDGAAGVAHVLGLPNLKVREYVLANVAWGIRGRDPERQRQRWVVPPKSWLDPLTAQLATDEPELVRISIRLLGLMEADAKKALPAVEKHFDSKDGAIRLESLCASIRIRGNLSDEHFPLMDRVVDKEPIASKKVLLETLRIVSPNGEKYLWKTYKTHADPDVVQLALVSLYRSLNGSDELRDNFRDLVIDIREKAQKRYLAMIGMRNTGRVRADEIRTLVDVMLNDRDETARIVAARELQFYPRYAELIVPWLEKTSEECSILPVKKEAAYSLKFLKDWKRATSVISNASLRSMAILGY
jgi:hypothetical protein